MLYSADNFTNSARFLLNSPNQSANRTDHELRRVALHVRLAIAEEILTIARICLVDADPSFLSPFDIDPIYQSAVCFLQANAECGNAGFSDAIVDLKKCLGIVNTRWKIGGTTSFPSFVPYIFT